MTTTRRGEFQMTRLRILSSAIPALCLSAGLAAADSLPANVFTIDVPGAGTGWAQGTLTTGINPSGVIVGSYIDSNGAHHGYVRTAQGAITTVEVNGAGTGKNQGTFVASINAAGSIAGSYVDSSDVSRGFVRAHDGTITTFDISSNITMSLSINPAGAVTGYYFDSDSVRHGFVRAPDGTISTFDAPGAGTGQYQGTYPVSINPAGFIAGMYLDGSNASYGFVRAPDGSITNFDPFPSCIPYGAFHGTEVKGINAAGAIVGSKFCLEGGFVLTHGFLRAPDGTISTLSVPGSKDTIPHAIGLSGAVAGYYTDSNYRFHRFLTSPSGVYASFDIPDHAGLSGMSIGPNGVVTGIFMDASGVHHGFVRLP